MAVDFDIIQQAVPRANTGMLPDADMLNSAISVFAFLGGERKWPPTSNGARKLPFLIKDKTTNSFGPLQEGPSTYTRISRFEIAVNVHAIWHNVGGQNEPVLLMPGNSRPKNVNDVFLGAAWVSGVMMSAWMTSLGCIYIKDQSGLIIKGEGQEVRMHAVVPFILGEYS